MKKNTTNNLTAASVNRAQFKIGGRATSHRKSPQYIYTEEDLGEDILDAGITTPYIGEQHHFKLVPWISMLRSKIS